MTTLPVFLQRALLGSTGYTKQYRAIRSRLYGIEYFRYSEQVLRRTQNISAFSGRLYSVEYCCYFTWLMLSRVLPLFKFGYIEQKIFAISRILCRIEHFCSILLITDMKTGNLSICLSLCQLLVLLANTNVSWENSNFWLAKTDMLVS